MTRKTRKAGNNGFGLSFWEKVQFLFDEPTKPLEKVRLGEAMKKAKYLVSHYQKSVWYDLRYTRLSVKELKSFSRAKRSALYGLENGEMDVFVNDYTQLKIARALQRALDTFRNREVAPDVKREKVLETFKEYLFHSMYARYSGLKHNDLVLKQISEAVTMLNSVVYRLRGTSQKREGRRGQ